MSYITFLGKSALTEFRRKSLIDQLHVIDIRARWVHFVSLHAGDTAVDLNRDYLDQILAYGEEYVEVEEDNGKNVSTWFIQPRKGSISPWSSEASSIAQACGLGGVVKRIERGRIVKLWLDEDFDEGKAKKELHDRMTEDLGTTMPDLEAMFGEQYVPFAKYLSISGLKSQGLFQ